MPLSTKPRSLSDLEELETGLRMRDLMTRVHDFLIEHEADVELVDAVEFVIEENEDWIDPDLEQMFDEGRLRYGQA